MRISCRKRKISSIISAKTQSGVKDSMREEVKTIFKNSTVTLTSLSVKIKGTTPTTIILHCLLIRILTVTPALGPMIRFGKVIFIVKEA
jgi:hypothetical protein